MALKGLVKEADAQNNGDLEKVLKDYDEILSDNNTNIVCYAFCATRDPTSNAC